RPPEVVRGVEGADDGLGPAGDPVQRLHVAEPAGAGVVPAASALEVADVGEADVVVDGGGKGGAARGVGPFNPRGGARAVVVVGDLPHAALAGGLLDVAAPAGGDGRAGEVR